MLKEYPKFERGEIEEFFNNLSKREQAEIEEYIKYRQARGVSSKSGVQEIRRQILHFRFTIDKIQKGAPDPADGVPIMDYPRENPEDKITFYLKLVDVDADWEEKKVTDYVTENNQEITNSHLRRPLLVLENN